MRIYFHQNVIVVLKKKSGMEIKTGVVKYMKRHEKVLMVSGFADAITINDVVDDEWVVRTFRKDSWFYNPLAVSRTTGFKSRKVAKLNQKEFRLDTVLLELEITGDLVRGTGASLSDDDRIKKGIVYAGQEILSLKKL